MSNSGRRVLITGAAGFIGSHLAEAMIARDDEVIGVDNFDPFYDRALKERNVRRLAHQRFDFHELDIRNLAQLERVTHDAQPELVVHIAALAGVRPSIERPSVYTDVNVTGTMNVLEAARNAGCRQMLLASSSSVYGNRDRDERPFSEDDDVDRPISPYAATKRACELLCETHAQLYHMSIGCLRFFTVFGPSQRPDLAIAKFMRLLKQGGSIPMFGDGSTARDYTYIDDIVRGIFAAEYAVASHDGESFCRVWNLGGSTPVSLRELIETIADIAGVTPTVRQLPMQAGDVVRTYADLARTSKELGWHPRISLREGLERQWASLHENATLTAR